MADEAATYDTSREGLALRTIMVSGQTALAKPLHPHDCERVKDRVAELLGELEEAVLRDGADPGILRLIEEARAAIWE